MKSPCVKLCALDLNRVCLGCGRTVVEIQNWMQYSNEDKQGIIERSNQYKIEHNIEEMLNARKSNQPRSEPIG